eukprot:gene12773-15618_t
MRDILREHEWFTRWRFQRCQLAVEHGQRHEMAGALAHVIAQDRQAAVEKDKGEGPARFPAQPFAIHRLQCGAGHDHALFGLGKFRADLVEPRPAVLVGQRDTRRHFLHIAFRMQHIAFDERQGQCRRDALSN